MAARIATAVLALVAIWAGGARAAVVAHWRFDESSGTVAADSAGAFDGALSGAAAFVPGGVSGNAVSLAAASNSLVNVGTGFPGFTSGAFSVVSWVQTTSTDNDTFVLGKHESGTLNGYLVGLNASPGGGLGAANRAWFYGSSPPGQAPTSTTTVNDGAWHQIVGVYRSGGTISIYLDGSPAEAALPSATIQPNSAAFVIGGFSSASTPTARYSGLIDDVQVYDVALSDAEVQFLFQNPGQVVAQPVPSLGAAGRAALAGLILGASLLLCRREIPRAA